MFNPFSSTPQFSRVADLGNASTKGYEAMVKPGVPTTCYELAIFSLVQTGEIPEPIYREWSSTQPKANTLLIVDPVKDKRVTNPKELPINSIIGIYRRFFPGGKSLLQVETDSGWILHHMVRTMNTDTTSVLGGNNGTRGETKSGWSSNNLEEMFDWTGTEKTSMHVGVELPEPFSYGKDGEQKYVAFATPITEVVHRLARAYFIR